MRKLQNNDAIASQILGGSSFGERLDNLFAHTQFCIRRTRDISSNSFDRSFNWVWMDDICTPLLPQSLSLSGSLGFNHIVMGPRIAGYISLGAVVKSNWTFLSSHPAQGRLWWLTSYLTTMSQTYTIVGPPDPALTPPPGVTPDFQDPFTLRPYFIVASSFGLVVSGFALLLRMYTKIAIVKHVRWEDCKSSVPTFGSVNLI